MSQEWSETSSPIWWRDRQLAPSIQTPRVRRSSSNHVVSAISAPSGRSHTEVGLAAGVMRPSKNWGCRSAGEAAREGPTRRR